MKPTIYMTVGLPASGKSTWSKKFSGMTGFLCLSSDEIRELWYTEEQINIEHDKIDHEKIFNHIYKKSKEALNNGNSVIIDATNISQKRRIHFNKEFKKYNKVAVYFNTPYETCVIRDQQRERSVGENVIKRMYHTLQVPTKSEGWTDIHIVNYHQSFPRERALKYEEVLTGGASYSELFDTYTFRYFSPFDKIYELPQDNSYHSFSVSRHTYHVYDYVYSNYPLIVLRGGKGNEILYGNQEDFLKMLWLSVLHDLGKGYTKSFKNYKGETKRYASFIGHENVSAQIAVNILSLLSYKQDFILEVAELCQNHMKLLNASDKGRKKLLNMVGEEIYRKLEFFKEADTSAK